MGAEEAVALASEPEDDDLVLDIDDELDADHDELVGEDEALADEVSDEQQQYVTEFERLPRSEPRILVRATTAVRAAIVANSTT